MCPAQWERVTDLPREMGMAWKTPVGFLLYSRRASKKGVR